VRNLKIISAQSNPAFKMLKAILDSRGIIKHRKALLAGKRIIEEALKNHSEKCLALITKKGSSLDDLASLEIPSTLTHYELEKNLFNEIDVWNATDYLLLVESGELPAWEPQKSPDGCTLFVPFQDPANVGAVIRSAAAFGVSAIVFLKEAAHPFHPKSTRAASGNLFSIPMFNGPSVKSLNTGDIPLFVLDMDGEDIRNTKPPKRFGLLCGMEGPGIPDNIRSSSRATYIRIPISESVESLNAAVATSIALYVLQ
jgi:tRNA G18 (ribose-2'-O)-methylase SpoU